MTDYLPVAEDIKTELAEVALSDDLGAVSEKLGIARARLEHLIAHDPDAVDLIRAARLEHQFFVNLRVEMMADEALDTLVHAMRGEIPDKKATAAVRAAAETLDRGALPKITRQNLTVRETTPERALPDLADLIEGAGSDEEAHEITDQYRELFNRIDALKRGAKEVIDGEVIKETVDAPD